MEEKTKKMIDEKLFQFNIFDTKSFEIKIDNPRIIDNKKEIEIAIDKRLNASSSDFGSITAKSYLRFITPPKIEINAIKSPQFPKSSGK